MTHLQLERILMIGQLNGARAILENFFGNRWYRERLAPDELEQIKSIASLLGDFVNGMGIGVELEDAKRVKG